jgi:ubiquinone/menaquinone biosynthesis C-methylase UbiE
MTGISRNAEVLDCNLIAPWYEPVEHLCFGRALERRRTAFVSALGGSQSALSCGEGDGRFMAALLRSNPQVHVTAVDASTRMMQVANERVAAFGPSFRERADYYCAEVGGFEPPRIPYDLIATHFFFDCFSTRAVEQIIQRIAGWAAPRAQWVVSEFTQPPNRLGHLWTGAVIRGLYAAFRLTTGLRTTHLPDYRPALAAAGFKLQRENYGCGGLLVSELWESGQ